MKEIQILFSTPMVQAIIAGRKTQTRRVIKPQPSPEPARIKNWGEHFGWMPESPSGKVGIFQPHSYRCPYGKVGDVLWVRETFYAYGHWRKLDNGKFKFIDLTMDEVLGTSEGYLYAENPPKIVHKGKEPGAIGYYKRPSLFMPYVACRIKLEITGMRVERLDDISEDDAINEGIGIVCSGYEYHDIYQNYLDKNERLNPIPSYASLWKSINGPESWDANPFVWVIEFKQTT